MAVKTYGAGRGGHRLCPRLGTALHDDRGLSLCCYRSRGQQEWEIPRDLDQRLETKDGAAKAGSSALRVCKLHEGWWEGRIARQKEIENSIDRAADVEMLYDHPDEDKTKMRVARPGSTADEPGARTGCVQGGGSSSVLRIASLALESHGGVPGSGKCR